MLQPNATARIGRNLPRALDTVLGPVKHWRATHRHRTGLLRRSYPSSERIHSSNLVLEPWYYSMELVPGYVTEGRQPRDLPLLPRLMLRRCELDGASCLDVGTMEGLIPVLMRRGGAREVLAVDFSNHCLAKLDAVRHYHGVDFEYRTVGLMYDLHNQLAPRGFDLVNLSGILYHVFSPLSLLAAVRPLVRRGGLLLASTNITLDPGYAMDFNAGGRMQSEPNTFWYPSARLFEYMLRYLRLVPIDCSFVPHVDTEAYGLPDKRTGYASVVCRAVDEVDGDEWMQHSARSSWEYQGLSNWNLADKHPRSAIRYNSPHGQQSIDLAEFIASTPPVQVPATENDGPVLRLGATG